MYEYEYIHIRKHLPNTAETIYISNDNTIK